MDRMGPPGGVNRLGFRGPSLRPRARVRLRDAGARLGFGIGRPTHAGLAALVYGGLELFYLPLAEEVADGGEVPEPPHGPLMPPPGRPGKGAPARLCREAQSVRIGGEYGPMGAGRSLTARGGPR